MDYDSELVVPLRPFRIMNGRVAFRLFALAVALLVVMTIAIRRELVHDDYIFLLTTFGALSVFVLLPRLRVAQQGGVPPLKFAREAAVLPLSINTRKTREIPYPEILSAVTYGKDKGAVLVIDTEPRAFVYPLHELAVEGDVAGAIVALLRRRLAALPGGAQSWSAVEKRQALAARFAGSQPRATRALALLIALCFLGQMEFDSRDIYGLLDMGANAPALALQGEWYRFVTANLLHHDWFHLFMNTTSLLAVGGIVERQLGGRRFLMLAFATGILSHMASALWMTSGFGTPHAYSVGISGALFGLLGGQVALNRQFGRQLPGGYRFTRRFWWVVFGVYFVAFPLLLPIVDTACHAGGFLSGIAFGWLLCEGQEDVAVPPPWGAAQNLALGLLAALWLAGAAEAARHALDPALREDDHIAFAKATAKLAHSEAFVDNALAWDAATKAKLRPGELETALFLATRAVGESDDDQMRNDAVDTIATTKYRLGDFEGAVSTEKPLLFDKPPADDLGREEATVFKSQLARFLLAREKGAGPRFIGDHNFTPQLTLDAAAGTWRLELKPLGDAASALPPQLPNGARFYAVLQRDAKAAGLLEIILRPGVMTAEGQLSAAKDGATALTLAETDTTCDHCSFSADVFSDYTPITAEIAKLP
jgi:membrane associated rhomboid family serine protease